MEAPWLALVWAAVGDMTRSVQFARQAAKGRATDAAKGSAGRCWDE